MRRRARAPAAVIAALLLAAAAPMPGTERIDAALAGTAGLQPATNPGDRLSRAAFPLLFAAQRSHGCYVTEASLHLCLRSHGDRPGWIGAISLELLIRRLDTLEADLATLDALAGGLGLQPAAPWLRATLLAARERVRARRAADPQTWPQIRIVEESAAGGLHARIEGAMRILPAGDLAYAIVQLTDPAAPQLAWPRRSEVEALLPVDRRFAFDDEAVRHLAEPHLVDLRCAPAGAGRVRCRYVNTIEGWIGEGGAPRRAFADLFEKSEDGHWRLLAPDAEARRR
ncbi:hypothetical protein E2493_19175 [Sphingomonas parva]|uniref:Uncharacterized protein n=1 Tax=Sphingomonas parva TaxID=2555898 RepID=A0A4Y8ZN92_9SPHN|nr:hypothetical protein [Sphingomonas parva]TFI56635.1 hypothetical protein E2493_19175 [Sphingomonas parva]